MNNSTILTSVLKVKGLDCPDCAKDIQKAVVSMSGVQSAEVNFAAEKLKVMHNKDEASVNQIIKVLTKMGHPATLEGGVQESTVTSTLKVKGIDCPDCAKDIQAAVSDVSGVHKAEVNFAAQKLKIEHDTDDAVITNVLETLARMGHPGTVEDINTT